jgi:hydroxypyruvate isomerase
MNRREFLRNTATGAAGIGLGASSLRAQEDEPMTAEGAAKPHAPFALDYAPHFGMFRAHAGNDQLDQLRFMADQGFRSFECNGMKGIQPEQQTRIRKTLDELNMRMGVFVAHAEWRKPSFASRKKEDRERILKDIDESIEVAKRVGAQWATVVLGLVNPRVPFDFQMAWVVDNLRFAAERCEKSGLVMVLEPLNPRDHPNMLLAEMGHAYQICRAVDSPSCKILCDLYHQQITEGNLIPNIDRAWDEIAYFQIGDNPGRNEPTTGEINYANIFAHIKRKGFEGVLGMEHGLSGRGPDGERAVIDAYRAVDPV